MIAQMTDLRDRSYRHVTRGWWWRGFWVGLVIGAQISLVLHLVTG